MNPEPQFRLSQIPQKWRDTDWRDRPYFKGQCDVFAEQWAKKILGPDTYHPDDIRKFTNTLSALAATGAIKKSDLGSLRLHSRDVNAPGSVLSAAAATANLSNLRFTYSTIIMDEWGRVTVELPQQEPLLIQDERLPQYIEFGHNTIMLSDIGVFPLERMVVPCNDGIAICDWMNGINIQHVKDFASKLDLVSGDLSEVHKNRQAYQLLYPQEGSPFMEVYPDLSSFDFGLIVEEDIPIAPRAIYHTAEIDWIVNLQQEEPLSQNPSHPDRAKGWGKFIARVIKDCVRGSFNLNAGDLLVVSADRYDLTRVNYVSKLTTPHYPFLLRRNGHNFIDSFNPDWGSLVEQVFPITNAQPSGPAADSGLKL